MIARFLLSCVIVLPLSAQAPTVKVGAFVDTYFAWDTGRPAAHDRSFTTQAVRHNEFNINLAHVEVSLNGERVRGRLALQAGTAVQSNYAGEPALGVNSGPTLSRHLQEAVIGVRVAPTLWIDGGVYFSPIGNESWISRDNPAYTRSFTAEYTPYYSSGVKATWMPSAQLSMQFHLVNGWQNISETNDDKAITARVDWTPAPEATFSWAAFRGNERPAGEAARLRTLHQGMAKLHPAPTATFWITVDRGSESGGGVAAATWWSATGIAEFQLSPTLSLAARAERYVDRDGVLIPVGVPEGFDVTSGSVGLNLRLPSGVTWRTEGRIFRSQGAVWPDRTGLGRRTALAVTSLSLTM